MPLCIFCQGPLDPATQRCQRCGQQQPARPGGPALAAAAAEGQLLRRCPHCGAAVPLDMRFCGYCAQPLSPLSELSAPGDSTPSVPPLAEVPPGRGVPAPGWSGDPMAQAGGLFPPAEQLVGAIADPSFPPAQVGASWVPVRPPPSAPGVRPSTRAKVFLIIGVPVLLVLLVSGVLTAYLLTRTGVSSTHPHSPSLLKEFALPTQQSADAAIIVGGDGNLWVTQDGHLGRITPTGTITTYAMPNPDDTFQDTPTVLVADRALGDVIWYLTIGSIGFFSAKANFFATEHPLPSSTQDMPAIPSDVTMGPDGNLWFTLIQSAGIGRRSTRSLDTSFYPQPFDSSPQGITPGPDGNLWFVEANADKIGRITPSGTITLFPLAAHSIPLDIVAGPDGNLWFTESTYNQIGRITPSGTITFFPVQYTSGNQIVAGPDGALWFTTGGPELGRITPRGIVTTFSLPEQVHATDLVAGPDGNIWFTEFGRAIVGRFTPPKE